MKEISLLDVSISGYIPSSIGKITQLHADYYNRRWNFGLAFESKVARELSGLLTDDFLHRNGFLGCVI